jgi:hypothetical protein
MKRRALPPLAWLALGLLTLCSLGWILQPGEWRPEPQAASGQKRVFAYRQWQSTGIKLEPGDYFRLRARGEWSYSPVVGLNGPEGGRPAVTSYPLPQAPGGALIGRVGENGPPFPVGRQTSGYAPEGGVLFLRINDDLLGDNEGEMMVEVTVRRATPTPRP